jgi:hypothetical protein
MPVPGRPQLRRRQLGFAQRESIAAVTLIARGVPFVAELARRFGLKDILAEFDCADLFGGLRILRAYRSACDHQEAGR